LNVAVPKIVGVSTLAVVVNRGAEVAVWPGAVNATVALSSLALRWPQSSRKSPPSAHCLPTQKSYPTPT
jgi:hypothetical protein